MLKDVSSQSCLKKSVHNSQNKSCKEVRLPSKELKVTILKILKRLIQNFNLECVTKKKKAYILNKGIARRMVWWFGTVKIEHRYLEISTPA